MSREIMQQALATLKNCLPVNYCYNNFGDVSPMYKKDGLSVEKINESIKALEAELAKFEQDWNLLAKTQESLREHMAKVKELEAELAKQTILDKKADNARELGLDYEPEQEPVAWMMPEYGDVLPASQADGTGIYNIPLYTAPPRKEWVGLTDDEKEWIYIAPEFDGLSEIQMYCVIEAKLKDKNNAV